MARGLARREKDYKSHLEACDGDRRGDMDGRGTLSEAALASFAEFFLRVSIDQVEFMIALMQADRLRDRVMIWAEEEMRAGNLPPKSDIVLKAIFYQGVLERGEIDTMLGMSERTARRITSALLKPEQLRLKARARRSIWHSRQNTRSVGYRAYFPRAECPTASARP